ncbi:MAG: hypothetical protein JW892_01505 [Anaerolineae bacterium]|nr:hypothetical protein [Anaerolineae bacterium]
MLEPALRYGSRWMPGATLLLWLLLTTGLVLAQEPDLQQAGLIIVGEEGVVTTVCVTFTEPELTGLSLLERSGVALTLRSGGGGTTICAIDGLGCPATDCFCQCKTAPCQYWSYFHRQADGTWSYSARGADSWPIVAGAVDAWVWGDGTVSPPNLGIAEICAPAVTSTPVLMLTPSLATPMASPTPALETPLSLDPTPPPMPSTDGAPATSSTGYGLFALLLLVLLGFTFIRRARRRQRT